MGCLDSLITTDSSIPSRLGLYANNLPGVTLQLFDGLTTDDQADYLALWSTLYDRAIVNFINDCKGQLADKFHIDEKLVSRETSEFELTTVSQSSPGIQIYYYMPKYARLYITYIQVYSNTVKNGAQFTISEVDDDNTVLSSLGTVTANLTVGLNTIYVNQEFEFKQRLFITYDSGQLSLRQTVNRYFNFINYSYFEKLACSYPCLNSDYTSTIFQINGGGINVVFDVVCSISKFICQNINFFGSALWWKIGVEIMIERIMSDNFNRFTTLTEERAKQLMDLYQAEYDKQLKMSVNNIKVNEDYWCFTCKSAVSAKTLLP